MKHISSLLMFLLIALTSTLTIVAQDATQVLNLEDIYKNGTYATRYYQSVRWMKDSRQPSVRMSQ